MTARANSEHPFISAIYVMCRHTDLAGKGARFLKIGPPDTQQYTAEDALIYEAASAPLPSSLVNVFPARSNVVLNFLLASTNSIPPLMALDIFSSAST